MSRPQRRHGSPLGHSRLLIVSATQHTECDRIWEVYLESIGGVLAPRGMHFEGKPVRALPPGTGHPDKPSHRAASGRSVQRGLGKPAFCPPSPPVSCSLPAVLVR